MPRVPLEFCLACVPALSTGAGELTRTGSPYARLAELTGDSSLVFAGLLRPRCRCVGTIVFRNTLSVLECPALGVILPLADLGDRLKAPDALLRVLFSIFPSLSFPILTPQPESAFARQAGLLLVPALGDITTTDHAFDVAVHDGVIATSSDTSMWVRGIEPRFGCKMADSTILRPRAFQHRLTGQRPASTAPTCVRSRAYVPSPERIASHGPALPVAPITAKAASDKGRVEDSNLMPYQAATRHPT